MIKAKTTVTWSSSLLLGKAEAHLLGCPACECVSHHLGTPRSACLSFSPGIPFNHFHSSAVNQAPSVSSGCLMHGRRIKSIHMIPPSKRELFFFYLITHFLQMLQILRYLQNSSAIKSPVGCVCRLLGSISAGGS